MKRYNKMNEKALQLCYSFLITIFKSYKDGCFSEVEYKMFKKSILYDRAMIEYWIELSNNYEEELWDKSNERAVNLLNELFEMGAINNFDYETQKETYMLYI